MESIQQQTETWTKRINDKWEEYQANVRHLRDLMKLDADDKIEWDRCTGFAVQMEKILSRLGTFQAGRDDESWANKCLDDACELCHDLTHWNDTVEVLISCWDDEDAGK